ncbi:uncharacterized protein ZBAI_08644 [Zygosaccharomyces bailii ISA1307]|nr:uncharacterized protein ZBAI_08644 [Zygosaccharomyces bailii ISA1307]
MFLSLCSIAIAAATGTSCCKVKIGQISKLLSIFQPFVSTIKMNIRTLSTSFSGRCWIFVVDKPRDCSIFATSGKCTANKGKCRTMVCYNEKASVYQADVDSISTQ